MSDANLTTTNTQNYITTLNTFSAPRVLTIPDRSSLNAYYIQFVDTANAISVTNTLTIRTVTGQINGAASVVVNSPGAYVFLAPNSTGYSATIIQTAGVTVPGGTSGQVQYNNAGVFGGFTLGGDATLVPSTGVLTFNSVNSNTGTWGGATFCSAFTVNAKGLITAAAQSACTPAIANVTGLGTGVATALGGNVGTAGAFVVNGGALGTPASGTLTNATGLPLTSGVTGNLPVTNLNSGTSASSSTFWRGDGTWATPAGGGTVTSVSCAGVTITSSGTCPPAYGFTNCSITASVASNNLTVALKDNTGADPSVGSPCTIYFRSATATTGSWHPETQTAALSFTANSGSTFGVTNTAATCSAAASCAFRLWVVAMDTGSGIVLGVTSLTNMSQVLGIDESAVYSSTACAACATATALGTIYSTAAQTSLPIVILGYLEWGNGLATAGTYASAPTKIQTKGPSIATPGQSIGQGFSFTSSGSSRACSASYADVAGTSISYTAKSKANRLLINYNSNANVTAGGSGINTEIFGTIAIGGVAQSLSPIQIVGAATVTGANQQTDGSFAPAMLIDASTLSPQTFTLQSRGLNTSGNCNVTSATGSVIEIQG